MWQVIEAAAGAAAVGAGGAAAELQTAGLSSYAAARFSFV